jgi:hypothetical protein
MEVVASSPGGILELGLKWASRFSLGMLTPGIFGYGKDRYIGLVSPAGE